jgi:nucleoside-diphosphate-sugar epimerase
MAQLPYAHTSPSQLRYANIGRQYVLVTGATGFIGAHVVDQLLSRGIRVRGATRSLDKGEAMMKARPQHAGKLDFVQIKDFDEMNSNEQLNMFDEAVKGVDGIIHTASVRLRHLNPF